MSKLSKHLKGCGNHLSTYTRGQAYLRTQINTVLFSELVRLLNEPGYFTIEDASFVKSEMAFIIAHPKLSFKELTEKINKVKDVIKNA